MLANIDNLIDASDMIEKIENRKEVMDSLEHFSMEDHEYIYIY